MDRIIPPSAHHIRPFSGQVIDGAHYFACRIYYEDTDLSGIVYHANYLRYCERARSDMLRQLGIDQRAAVEDGTGAYAVRDMRIHYHRPARLDDDLVIITTVEKIRAAALDIHHQVIKAGDNGQYEPLTTLSVTAAFMDLDGRARRQPDQWREIYSTLHVQENL